MTQTPGVYNIGDRLVRAQLPPSFEALRESVLYQLIGGEKLITAKNLTVRFLAFFFFETQTLQDFQGFTDS